MGLNQYILRADLNVPVDKVTGRITNSKRIDAVIPTIKQILSDPSFGRLVILTHFGRPSGKHDYSLSTIGIYEYMLDAFPSLRFISYVHDYKKFFGSIKDSDRGIYLMDNIRFYPEEESLNEDFSKAISRLGNIFIMDAFGTIHRSHASTVGPKLYSDIECKYGPLVKKELEMFNLILVPGDKPKTKTAILGGAKIFDKIKLVDNIIEKVDNIVIGGGMAFTFLKVLYGYEIGDSLFDDKGVYTVKYIAEKCRRLGTKLHLPIDVVINDNFGSQGDIRIVDVKSGIPTGYLGLDIGPATCKRFGDVLEKSDIVIWNGPLGVFEIQGFEKGSVDILKQIAGLTYSGTLTSIIGGGDTASMCETFGFEESMTFVSTGGGASLDLLGGDLKLLLE